MFLRLMTLVRSEWRGLATGMVAVFLIANGLLSGWDAGFKPDLSLPYSYQGDMLFHSWMVQRVIEGWLFENPRSGFPFGSSFLDYPGSDAANHLLLKWLGLLGGDFQSAINLYYLLGFVVTFVAAYLVLRKMGLSASLAWAGALVFDLLPFHFMRIGHLFYSWYFLVPVFFGLGLWCFQAGAGAVRPWRAVQWLGLSAGLLVAASFGVYNALFGVIVLLAAGMMGSIRQRAFRPVALAGGCAAVIALGVALNVAPNVVHRMAQGTNPEATSRLPMESEVYALKLVQLVAPRPMHRQPQLAAFTEQYGQTFPLVNDENQSAALGVIGTAGLLALAAVIALRLSGGAASAEVSLLALVVSVLFLFGTIGGLGSLFALLVSPAIRGWSRISVFIGFGAIAALLLLLQGGLARRWPAPRSRRVHAGVALALVLIALYDQTIPFNPRQHAALQQDFERDRSFVRGIEAQLPAGAAVYQLPYIAFPETPTKGRMGHYVHLTGFLHSHTLKWSHGGMKGRPGDMFYRALAEEPVARQIELIRKLGFAGIWLDRNGYEDGGRQMMAELSAALGHGPALERADRQVAFFVLGLPAHESLEGLPSDEILRRVGYVADRYGARYEATLAQGVNFSRAGLPAFLRGLDGLSLVEPWGRWSDAKKGPAVRFDFVDALPPQFTLTMDVVGFGPNDGKPFRVRMGDTEYPVRLPLRGGLLQLQIENPGRAHVIEIIPPAPISPKELGLAEDFRQLSIGFRSFRIRVK